MEGIFCLGDRHRFARMRADIFRRHGVQRVERGSLFRIDLERAASVVLHPATAMCSMRVRRRIGIVA